ncbi:MAG: HepT-like ribonuclease domain-containing protein [Patescibacteria group bacterium]
MDRKIDTPYLLHIRDAIALIQEWSAGKTIEDFTQDEKLQSAIIRQLEIIGEAARNVSDERKIATPEIPWRPITNTRNTLIHGYFTVDEKKVWDMVQIDIPVLQKHIDALLEKLESEDI